MTQEANARVFLIRHGETAWSLSGQHTGKSNIPLTPKGEEQATRLATRLAHINVDRVFCSPMQRAKETCKRCGLLDRAEIDPDLCEWDYGNYEGLTTAEIRAQAPGWLVFRDGAPGGESPNAMRIRMDRMIQKIRTASGNVVLFSSGHVSRALGARWLDLEVEMGKNLYISTASLSELGYERETPVIKLWNDVSHLQD